MSNEGPRDPGVRSVERAIAILDLLALGDWRTVAEVARGLQVHRSTALRLLATLQRHALVAHAQRTARYPLGRPAPPFSSRVPSSPYRPFLTPPASTPWPAAS